MCVSERVLVDGFKVEPLSTVYVLVQGLFFRDCITNVRDKKRKLDETAQNNPEMVNWGPIISVSQSALFSPFLYYLRKTWWKVFNLPSNFHFLTNFTTPKQLPPICSRLVQRGLLFGLSSVSVEFVLKMQNSFHLNIQSYILMLHLMSQSVDHFCLGKNITFKLCADTSCRLFDIFVYIHSTCIL